MIWTRERENGWEPMWHLLIAPALSGWAFTACNLREPIMVTAEAIGMPPGRICETCQRGAAVGMHAKRWYIDWHARGAFKPSVVESA